MRHECSSHRQTDVRGLTLNSRVNTVGHHALLFWRTHSQTYPTLKRVALRINRVIGVMKDCCVVCNIINYACNKKVTNRVKNTETHSYEQSFIHQFALKHRKIRHKHPLKHDSNK